MEGHPLRLRRRRRGVRVTKEVSGGLSATIPFCVSTRSRGTLSAATRFRSAGALLGRTDCHKRGTVRQQSRSYRACSSSHLRHGTRLSRRSRPAVCGHTAEHCIVAPYPRRGYIESRSGHCPRRNRTDARVARWAGVRTARLRTCPTLQTPDPSPTHGQRPLPSPACKWRYGGPHHKCTSEYTLSTVRRRTERRRPPDCRVRTVAVSFRRANDGCALIGWLYSFTGSRRLRGGDVRN